jgi:hypothetical protein
VIVDSVRRIILVAAGFLAFANPSYTLHRLLTNPNFRLQ